jgi:hypothetical protein
MDEPVTNAPRCVIPHQFMPYGCHTIVITSTASVFVPKRSPVWERPIAHRSLGPMWEAYKPLSSFGDCDGDGQRWCLSISPYSVHRLCPLRNLRLSCFFVGHSVQAHR